MTDNQAETAQPKKKRKRWVRGLLIAVAILLLLFVVIPYFIPVPPLAGLVAAEQLADADSQFAEVAGLRFHYKLKGAGEPFIVLLHGFGASLYSWRDVMEPLSRLGTVLAYDRPAFGLTARPLVWTGENPYAPAAQVGQLIAWLDRLGVQKAILVGHSAGGTLAAETALRYPERVQALVLVDPAVYASGGLPEFVRILAQFPPFRRLGPLLVRSIGEGGIDFLKSAWHDPAKITPEILEGYRKPLKVLDWDAALWEFTLANGSGDLAARVTQLAVPTLVITGNDDQIVPTEQSIRLASQIPGASLLVIPECGHLPQEEKSAEFLKATNGFLAALTP
ncbi:MAG: alpha/beta hydrolase [bacterium]